MKKMNYLLCSFLMLPLFCGYAAVPEGEPALTLKSTRGTLDTESRKTISIYLKNKEAETEAYIDWGLGGKLDTLAMAKANTLYSKKMVMTLPDASIRIWGKGLNFVNCNGADIYAIEAGADAATLAELRCTPDSLHDFTFLKDLPGLTYLVCGSNPAKEVTISSTSLQRLDMGSFSALEKLRLDCPALYEFKLSYSQVDTMDLRKCPALTTVSMVQNAKLRKFYIGEATSLKSFTCANTQIDSLSFNGYPSLTTLSVYSNMLEYLQLKDLPVLGSVVCNKNVLPKLEIKDLPMLKSITCDNNPMTSFSITDCPLFNKLYINNTLVRVLDLSDCGVLGSLKANDCELVSVQLSPIAMNSSLSSLDLRNNNLTLSSLPAKPAKLSVTANYYAPQREFVIPKSMATGDMIDMSSHLTGKTPDSEAASTLVWLTLFEEELEENSDFMLKDGVFTFLTPNADSIYCVVSNPAFPLFKGEDAYKTNKTLISVADGIEARKNISSRIYTNGKTLTVIPNSGKAEFIMIFDITGKIVAKATVSDEFTYTVPTAGIYLIKMGDSYEKIILQ